MVANPAVSSDPLVSMRALSKWFDQLQVLDAIDLDVERGAVLSVIGPSGSGKTTLLRCINLLETYQRGSLKVDGVEVGYHDSADGPRRKLRSERELARIRADIGMVFQMFNLFPHLTAAENVMLGLRKVRKMAKTEARGIAEHWLNRVGLSDKFDNLPAQLSGGQQQRVGIARAIVTDPTLIVADEPTGDLDAKSAEEILDLLGELRKALHKTILLVTHDPRAAQRADRVLHLDKGRLVEAAAVV
jgi:polar amino acid transport system ATP-binding protein